MKKIIHWLDINFEAFFGMIAFFLMWGIILMQIFGRNILGSGTAWGEEICKYCYVWVAYIGISYCTRANAHIEIDALRRKLPEKAQKVLMIITNIIMLYLFVRFFLGTLANARLCMISNKRALSIDISQNWMYIAGPIGYGLGILRCIQNLVWKFRYFNCSMPVFVNPSNVLDGGLENYAFDDAIREEYREKVPEEAYAEVAAMREQRRLKKNKKKEG